MNVCDKKVVYIDSLPACEECGCFYSCSPWLVIGAVPVWNFQTVTYRVCSKACAEEVKSVREIDPSEEGRVLILSVLNTDFYRALGIGGEEMTE